MFDGQDFLDVARHLQHADSREGFQRSAISRAYYAAFHSARAVCREQGWIEAGGSGSDHRKLSNALAQLDLELVTELRELRLLRNEVDYSADEQNAADLTKNVEYAIELAELIRTKLERLS